MQFTITPTDQDIFLALWSFLTSILPSGDAVYTGSITGDQLTVTAVKHGTLKIGDPVLAEYAAQGTVISAFGTGTGGVGDYTVSPNQGAQPVASCRMTAGIEIVQGQGDRVPEPTGQDFITMVVLRAPRLSTNLEDFEDVTFTGSIAGSILTVAAPLQGAVRRGVFVFGAGVAASTSITGYLTATGGLGTYYVAPAQNVGPVLMATGVRTIEQDGEWVIQLDLHGPNSATAAQVISTLFRSEVATDFFSAFNPAIAPLFADDPRQMAFHNGEQQYENRYIVEVHLQVNQTVLASQQFATSATLTVVEIDTIPDLP